MSNKVIVWLTLVVAVAMLIARWWYVVGIPPLNIGIPVVVVIAGLVYLAIDVLRRVVFSDIVATSIILITVLASTIISWSGFIKQNPTSFTLTTVGLFFTVILITVIRHNATLWKSWKEGLIGAVILFIGLFLLGITQPYGEWVWSSADQLHIAGTARSLLVFNFDLFHFQLGLPLLLAPFIMIANLWQVQDAHLLANLLNSMVLPVHIIIIVPLIIGLIVRTVADKYRVLYGAVAGMGLLAYRLFPPAFVPSRNEAIVPLGFYGLIYSPEIIGLLFVAIAVRVLYRLSWNPVVVGALAGITLWTSERHLLVVGPLLALLFTVPTKRMDALRTSVVAGLVMIPQLLYFRIFYKGWLFPNREYIWERHAERWVGAVENRYGFIPVELPERIDLAYLPTNLPQVLIGNWWWLTLFIGVIIAAFYILNRKWRLWVFCSIVVASHIILSTVYINIVVSWRYNFIVMPLVIAVTIAVTATLSRRYITKYKDRL